MVVIKQLQTFEKFISVIQTVFLEKFITSNKYDNKNRFPICGQCKCTLTSYMRHQYFFVHLLFTFHVSQIQNISYIRECNENKNQNQNHNHSQKLSNFMIT